jgi:2-dehydro-3-deoxyphosphogluconate aldolase/(4S)-4-hydroxy-2-oxoglutarate aldolase
MDRIAQTTPDDHHRTLREALRRHRILVILRTDRADPRRLVDTVLTLLDAGIRCLEITLPTPGSLDALRELTGPRSGRLPADALLGAGTVLTAAETKAVAAAGGRFTVSPILSREVLDASAAAGLGSLPGVFTPTEAYTAMACGATAAKLFPAHALGPGTVAAIRAPLPDLPLVPTGGVTLDTLRPYLEAGALAVGIGSPIIGDALNGGSLPELRARAAKFAAAAAS